MQKKIYCVGGAAIDRKLQAAQKLIANNSNPVETTTHFGGVARNIAENLANWTQDVSLHTVVGADDDGIQMLSAIKQKSVDIKHSIILKGARTASYYAVMEPTGDLSIALADMTIFDQVPLVRFTQSFELWEENQILFLDTNLCPEIIASAIAAAREKKLTICVDPVSANKALKMPRDLQGIFLLKPNPLEASALTNMPVETIGDALMASEILLRRGVANVILTLGKAGYVVVNDEIKEFIAIDPIHDVLNVNGAGDAFMAGIIFGLQQGFTLMQACQWGVAAASFTVTTADTVAANLTPTQLQAFIHNQKKITGHHHANIF